MANDPLRTAWFPPERSGMILDRNSGVSRARPGLNQSQKIAIGIGTTAGVLILIGIILGAVLGTQLNKGTSPIVNVTRAPPPSGNASEVQLDTEMTLDNVEFTNDLKDPNSEAYKNLANQVCDEAKKALPPDQVDELDCSGMEFSPGSVVVKFIFRIVVKKTVTVTKASFGNMVQSWLKVRFDGKNALKAKKDSFKFKNLGICSPNPCKYSGKCMDVGGGEFKCQCKPGKYGKTCDDDPTFCTCSGDPHCKTFDKLAMDYQGTCKFVLSGAKDKSFTVYSRNINIKGVKRVSWARYVELKYNDLVVRLGKLDPYNIKKPNAAWVNGVQVNLPFQNVDVTIYKQGQTLICRTKFGLMLTYGKWQARVGLTAKFKNKVTGFCGNFDGNKNNDATTSAGEFVFKKKNFGNIIGNSYIVQDMEKQPYSTSCKLSDDEVGSSACPGVDLKKALFLCQQIKDPKGKFKSCVKAMNSDDVSDFSSWCDFDVKQTCDASVATAAITTFIESCFEFNNTLVENVLDWKQEFNITKDDEFDDEGNCTGGTVPSTSGCQNTCDNQNSTQQCDLPDVVGSCSCPSGTFSFKDSCVTQSNCGCIHTDGSAHFVNESWLSGDCSKKFTCLTGGKISTSLNACQSGKTCVRSKCSACNPVNPCKNGGVCVDVDASPGFQCRCPPGYFGPSCSSSYAACQCFGDPHCITFDGMMLDYQGTRKHKLVEWTGDQMNLPFTIYGKNINLRGSTKVSYVNMVELSYNNLLIRMTKAFRSSSAPIIVTVNFEEVEIPYSRNNLMITRRGRFMEVNNDRGLLLAFSSKWQFKVKLSPDFFGKNLTGLCGNFDGKVDNDKRKADGSMAVGNTLFSWGRDLGDSFIVQNDTEDDEKLATPTDSTPPQCPPSVLQDARQTCAFITSTSGPFSKCLGKIPSDTLQQRYDWCMFDVSMTCDASLSLDSLALLADVCSEMDIVVEWRTVLKQSCQCSIEGMSCSGLAPPCIPSCQDPEAAENCTLPQVQDVCLCPPGKVLFQDKCVFVSECGCVDENGKSHQIGETWLTPDCRAFKCVRSNVIQPQTPACPASATCKEGRCVSTTSQCSNDTCDATGGKCLLTEKGTYLCRCKPGFTGKRCQYREATCQCKGDIHCRTFDSLYLDYQGLCKYVLVNSTDANYPFTVYGKHVVRFQKPRVSWILFGEIHFNGSVIRMGRNSADDKKIRIQVDGEPITVNHAWFPSFHVYKTGKSQVFQSSDKKLQVLVGSDWTIKIVLAEGGSGKVEGLCGNNNMLRSDDNKLRNGTMLTEVNVKKSGKLIGDSYVVDDPEVTNSSICTQPQAPSNPPPCPMAQAKRASSTCGAISDPGGVFAACFPPGNRSSNAATNVSEDFDVTQYKDWCNFDFNETCQFEAVDTAVSVFAQMCINEAILNSNLTIRRNVTINSTVVEMELETDVVFDIEAAVNFRTALNLTMTCDDPNSVYSPRSSGCPATCENPNAALDCLLPDVYDACICPLGFLLFRDLCVLPDDCGCIQNNSARLVGESWMTNNCTVMNTCLKDPNKTSVINSTSSSCPTGKQCMADNTCSACRPVSPCKNGAKCEEGTNTSSSSSLLYVCKCPPGFAGVDCGQVLSPFGSCHFFGNGHLITFDGLPLDLKTSCKVTLLKTPDFSVGLKTLPINGANTFSYLEVATTTVTVKLAVEQNASLLVYMNDSYSVEPPYNDTNFELKYVGEFVEFGARDDLKILFNGNAFEIMISTNFKGKTKGICGDFNGITSDDLKTSSGQQLSLTAAGFAGENETKTFVESFQDAYDAKSNCSLPKPPPRPPCSFDVLSLGDKCKELINPQGPLKDCLVNVTSLVLNATLNWCLGDVTSTCDAMVTGTNIAFVYSRCLQVDLKVPPPPLCDLLKIPSCQCTKPNTSFMPKSSACPGSCKNPNQPSKCRLADLTNICGCVEGFLLFQGKCVPEGNCGCFDDKGSSHNVGEFWLSDTCTTKYTCTSNGSIAEESFTCNKTCIKGRCTACTNSSQCVGGKCYDTSSDPGYFCRCNPGLVGDGLSCKRREGGFCSVYGDPHYISFDKQYFDYQGTSKFILLDSLDKTRPIRILSKNVPAKPKSKVSVLDYVEVLFHNKTFRLQRAYNGIFAPVVAKVNDDLLGIPFSSIDGSFNLSYDGDTLRFSTSVGISVAYMPMYRANVEAASHFKNNLTGFCGNFDGSPSNDLQVNGRDVTFLPDPGNAFGNSFVVENETSSSGPILSPDVAAPAPCRTDISAHRTRCQDMVSPDGPFGDCVKNVNPMEVQMAKDNCLFDLEQTCSADSVKIAFLTFARKCFHAYGVKVEKVKELECECTEPYTTCMATSSGCPATCSNPSSPDACPMSDSIFVCACEPGRLLFNGKCVLPGDCGCVHTDGRAFKVGESWLSEDCLLKLTCTSPNLFNSDVYNCPGNKTCVSGTCKACTKNTCGSNGECLETTSAEGYVCRCKTGFYGSTCSDALVTGSYANTHCTTFDKATFDFRGLGEFVLVRSTKVNSSSTLMPFEIRATNVYSGELQGLSCAKRVVIIITTHRITFEREGEGTDARLMTKLDNQTNIDLPYTGDDFSIIIKSPLSVSFVSKTGLGCSYDATESSVTVSLPMTYMTSGGISGLLGNFDGNAANDLVTADRRNVTNSTDPGNDIGLSYTNTSSPEFRNTSDLPAQPSCGNNILPLLDKCKQLSSLSGPLRPLVVKLGVGPSTVLQNDCQSDVRRSCSADAVCAAAKRMVEAVGISFNWRTPLACEVKCPDGFEPRSLAPGCLPTCKDPTADRTCVLPQVADGCTCPATKLFFKGRCVERSLCGCVDNSTGMSYEIGKTWRSEGCKVKLTCSVGGNATSSDVGGCAKGVCVRNRCSGCQVNPCTNGGTCLDVGDDGDYVCKCPTGFEGRRCDGVNNQADVTVLVEDGIGGCRGISDATILSQCIKNFTDTVKNFLKTLVDGLVIGPEDARVSVATFGSKVKVAWPLSEYSNVLALKVAIDLNFTLIFDNDGSVDLTNAVQSITNLINSDDLQRTPKLKILILLTDGGTDFDASLAPTLAKNLADARIGVCGVGLSSKVKIDVLKTLCSEPKRFNYNYYPYVGNVNVNVLKEATKLKEPTRTKPLNESAATCRCSGDPHCKSFDGQVINYQGTCKILMASNRILNATRDFPSFSLFLKSYHRGGNTRVSWVDHTEFVYNGEVVKFQRSGESRASQVVVTVGGRVVNIPYAGGDFSIYYKANFVQLQVTSSLLKVAYSSRGITFITLPDQFSNKVFGLCGNYDGNPRNDLKTRNGTDVSSKADPGKEIGDSYIEYYDADNAALLANCKSPMMKNQTCSADAKPWMNKCRQMTNASGIFKDCLAKLPSVAQEMQSDCLFDLEQTCDYSSVELSVAQFAAACMDAGVFVENWRGYLDLPCKCPKDKICLPKGSPCLPTHLNPDAGLQCPQPDTTDVCSCPIGKVLFNGICVVPEQAGCVDKEGGVRELKESWLSGDCQLLYTCASSNNISSESVSCPDQTTCINGKCSACLQTFPCQNGGLCVEQSECQPKSLPNPGCYWLRVPSTENSISSPAPLSTNSLSACFQSCLVSSSPCAGINWIPSAPLGRQCLLVPSLSVPAEENSDSTQYLWVCSDKPCDTETPSSKYKCACKRGFQGSNCETALGRCTLNVGARLETFDGQNLLFRSNCNTTLVRSKSTTTSLNTFSITVKNSKQNPTSDKFSRPRSFGINFKRKDLRIELPGAGPTRIFPSNGESPLSLPYKSSEFSINLKGSDLELETSFGLTVTLGSSGSVVVGLTPDYAGQVEGLCGDFDGDKNNDGNASSTDPGNFLSKRYFVPDVRDPSDVNCSSVDLNNNTMTSTTNKQRCQAITDMNGPFGECLSKLDAASLAGSKKTCELEVDVSLDELAACATLEKLLDRCNRDANVIISTNWRTVLGCKCSCADGFVCAPRSSGCSATCSNQNASLDCLDPDVQDVCVCPPGKVLSVDGCVAPEQCGCVDDGGRARQTMEQWLNEDCSIRNQCQKDGHVSSIPNNCPQGSICNNSMCSVCSVNNPCKKGVCKDVEGGGPPICGCPPGVVGKNCEIDNDNTCQVYGNGHCRTFDGVQLDYSGDCKVVLMESIPPLPAFKVLGKNYRTERNAFFLKYVEIVLNEKDVLRFEQTGFQSTSTVDVMLNKKYVEPPIRVANYTLQYKGLKLSLQSDFGLVVTFRDSVLTLAAPRLMSGNLRGLCGNFNGDKGDERVTAGGKNASTDQDVADSYVVLDTDSLRPNLCLPTEDREPPQLPPTPPPQDGFFTTTAPRSSTAFPVTYPPWNVTTSRPSATCQTTLLSNEITLCKQLSDATGSFGLCLKALNDTFGSSAAEEASVRARNCERDVASYCDRAVLHGYLSNMAATCSELGIAVDWAALLNTSYTCPIEGMSYQIRPTSPCMSTCSDPRATKTCPWNDMAGICSCQPGFVLHNKKCIFFESCGCVTETGEAYNVGSTWYEEGCTIRKTCIGAGNIKTEAAEGSCSIKCPECLCSQNKNI